MSGDHNMHCSANTKCTRCGKENPPEVHTCTPLALRLANELEDDGIHQNLQVAAELRRLYEVNAELVEALETCEFVEDGGWGHLEYDPVKVSAALARAKGESNAD